MNMNSNANNYHLLEQIEGNVLPILELTKEVEELFPDANCEGLLRYDDISLLLGVLSRNESIRCIRFEGDFLDCLHPLRRSELLRVVGSHLPGLVHIGLGDSPILVADLCHLVTHSKSLRSLHLHDSILQGTIEDFKALEEVLASHPTIQEFEIHECTSVIPGTNLKAFTHARKRRTSTTSVLQQRSVLRRNTKHLPIANRIDGERKR